MQTCHVTLSSPVATGYRCQRAADSLDIDAAKKAVHELRVEVDLETPWALGMIVGASGSGKTTAARVLFPAVDFERQILEPSTPVIEQFPAAWTYDQCAQALMAIGLSQVPCWIRPAHTLSNGQRARAEAALQLARDGDGPVVIDEWTSVVDRTVGKAMSHCAQKHARRSGRPLVLLSCHYDVIDWINPDWLIDCNTQTFHDRRSLWRSHQRAERLRFDVREVPRSTWRAFSRYHYLSDQLPGGSIFTYGLFHGADQIGFQCLANYTPTRPGQIPIYHSNRTVIHPDYVGLGLGMSLINLTCEEVRRKGMRVQAKFSSTPVYRAMIKDPAWHFLGTVRELGRAAQKGAKMLRDTGFRVNVTCYRFEFVGLSPSHPSLQGNPT